MPLKEIQKQVDQWTSQYDPQYWSPHEILAHLIQEVGELAREISHLHGVEKKKYDEKAKDLDGEIVDVIFALVCLANSKGIDLDKAFKRMMKEKLNKRDKNRWEKKKSSK